MITAPGMTTFSCQGGAEQNLQNGDLGLFEHSLLLTSIKTKCIDSEHVFDNSSHTSAIEIRFTTRQLSRLLPKQASVFHLITSAIKLPMQLFLGTIHMTSMKIV